MKTNFGIFFLCALFALTAWIMRQNKVYKPPVWLNGTPKTLAVGVSEMSGLFSVNEPAVIYWRIYPEGRPMPRFSDFTNTNMEGVVAYGGGILQAGGIYTNRAAGLNPGTDYILYAVSVPRAAAFGGVVKALPFHTAAELTKP